MAQNQRTISGTVLDETGEPLIGASVKVVGAPTGITTDFNGEFRLSVSPSAKQLTVTYVGYLPLTVNLTSENVYNLTLQPNNQVLDEVVVIGYGVRKKDDLTGAISSVSEKDFNKGVISSPEELVNGKIAGVQIVNSGGSPTSGSTIRVRGGASLNASNDPLIVLDGVPMEVGGSVSGSGNFLSLINPNDIESMTVLKDASSTAIYGSRASNGVIIITTKKGSGDGIKVSFQTTNSLSTKTKTSDMLSTEEFIGIVNQRGTDRQKSLIGTARTDWNKEIYQTAFGTDNNISVSGRAVKWLPFRVSAGAYYQDGILKTDNAKRYTGNLNLTPSFFNNELRLNLSVKGTYSQNRFAETSAIWGGCTLNPTIPVYSGNSSFGGYTEAIDGNGIPVTGALANAVGLLEQYHSTSDVYRVISNLDVDWSLRWVKGLRLHATGGYDWSKGEGHIYIPAEAISKYTTGGRDYDYGPQKNYNRLLTVYANFNRDFDEINSNLDVTAGYDYQYWKYTTPFYAELNIEGIQQSSSAATDQRHTLLSYYGRVNYTFMDRYLLTATMRRDGSSRFAKSNRWGTFPSVALAWRISKESFFEPLTPAVNDMKIRVSYGVTGQQDGITNYGYIPVYTPGLDGAQYQFGGNPVYTYRPEAYNPDLKWETTKSWNYGVDLAFLNNRFTLSADFYTRKTENLLATVPVPAGTNFNKLMLQNVGNVNSSGVEIAANAHLIDTKDWSWSVSANAAWQRVRIKNLTLTPGAPSPDTEVGPWIDAYQMQVFSTDYAPYSFYLYKQLYDAETGRPIEGLYADLDGDGEITNKDRYHCHSPAPDWILGLSTSLRYKKWTLSTSLRANIGGYIFNGMSMNTGAWETMSYNDYQLNNLNRSYLATGFTKRQFQSDYYLENASFLKMDNIQLTYDFGRIWRDLSLHASAMVQNVFTITNYSGVDPETANGVDTSVYPRPRTFSVTLGLNF
ncbi:MAG: TonB-dependent receptor [Firmicutes bacterium]|nr:TonB-dependent receptor [Bacillota bacterium]MCM1401514.1 TonB-dependent receptor [Bacteroides sp.]MCM1477364.1 TonB-dependent receptor [Bacteroides sp.]